MLTTYIIPIAVIGVFLVIAGGSAALFFVASAIRRRQIDQLFLSFAVFVIVVLSGVALVYIATSISASV